MGRRAEDEPIQRRYVDDTSAQEEMQTAYDMRQLQTETRVRFSRDPVSMVT